jgi:hypothetical protein
MSKVLWTVSLSNGETLYEDKGNFQTIEGALSPWRRLLAYMEEKSLTITSLSLYTSDGRRWNIPSMGKNPKFHVFAAAPKPSGYRFFRKFGQDQTGGNAGVEDHFTCIEAVYEGGTKMQVWVDESSLTSWAFIV